MRWWERDSRIAVRVASSWFNDCLGGGLADPAAVYGCAVSGRNSACLGGACPYFA